MSTRKRQKTALEQFLVVYTRSQGVPPRSSAAQGFLLILAASISLALAACSSTFDSQMTLSGYRVVGIEASTPELSPDDAVTLRVHEFYQGDEPISYEWSLCLFSVGAREAYECSEQASELSLGNDETLDLDLGPEGLELRQLLSDLPTLPNDDGTPRSLEQGFDVWVKLRSGPDCTQCESQKIDSVKRLRLSEAASSASNRNPVIDRFSVVGSTTRGQTIGLRVSTDEPEMYTEAGSSDSRQEEYLYSWYTAQGETDPTRSFGETQETDLRLPRKAGEFEVIVTVRDGRGGLAVARRTIAVQ